MIFARLLGLILTAPVFSRREIFPMAKVLLVFWTAGLLIYVVPVPPNLPTNPLTIVLAVICEALLGVMIGFVTDLLVSGLEFAGTLMDTQAGLSVASLLDPSTGRTITIISLLLKWSAFTMFLLIDGHHLVLASIVQSFKILPVASPINFSQGALEIVKLGSYLFFLGVQLSAPILLVVFIVDFGFGILNRVAEQINVFQLGFQIKPSVSLVVFLAATPLIVNSIYKIMEFITEHLMKIFHALQSVPQ